MEKISWAGGSEECYRISGPGGSEVVLARHGGHLISWKTADGVERLYLSELASFESGKAIRGGVPVIFPQFNANGPYARHGLARKVGWIPDLETEVMRLESSAETLEAWPFEFKVLLGVEPSEYGLEIEFSVKNTGDVSFPFHAALHTYFAVPDVTQCWVSGLNGLPFENEVTNQIESADEDSGICFGAEVDRSYRGASDRVIHIIEGDQDRFEIRSVGFPDVVVWNPGPNHGIGDLPEEGWKKYVCVESAQVQYGTPLEPGDSWVGRQKILAIN